MLKSQENLKKISVVISILNEEGNIGELYKRLISAFRQNFPTFDYELLFVDDGSNDDSFELLQELHSNDSKVRVIKFSRNFGHHIAITAGLDFAVGDYIVMMDGDLQDQPEEIVKLYVRLQEGYDVVYGERINKQFPFLKRILSNLFVFIIRRFIKEKIVINSTIFRIMNRSVVEAVKKLKEHNRYIIGIIGWVGFKHASVPVIHGKRVKGKTKYNFRRQLQLAFNAIFSYSDFPLKFIIKTGFFIVLLACFSMLFLLIKKFFYGIPMVGWTSLIITIMFIGGIQISFLGILGEYIGKIFLETKDRPLYIIEKILDEQR